MAKRIALVGDPSDHGGVLIDSATDNLFTVGGIPVCADGCLHDCPLPGHGITAVAAITVRSKVNGKLIVTENAMTGCGALITPPDRRKYVE